MALTCIVLESIPVKLKLAEHTGVGSYSFPALPKSLLAALDGSRHYTRLADH